MQFKSHLPISWDFSHYFYMSLYLCAFDLSFSWCLIATSTAGLSVPYGENVTHTIATPQPYLITLLCDFFHQLDLIQGTQQEDREAYFQGILLPQESTARRHVSLLHLCRLSSFWPTWRGLVGSILCIAVVKNLERSTLWDSKYATELSYSLSCDLDCAGNAAVTL